MINDFTYVRPDSVKETLALLSQYKDACKIICGGQSLLILMRQGLVAPELLIDIKGLKELDFIRFDPKEGLRIGAATPHRAIENSPVIMERYPVLADMESHLASIQTRNWGTIGGNLCHADPAGDPAPVLVALNATVKMANGDGERGMPVEDFSVDFFETALGEGGLLLEIQVPVPAPRTATAYEKFTVIESDHGIASVAASITLDKNGERCKDARLVLGAAAPTPKRARRAEEMLAGASLSEALLAQVGQAASEEAEPISDIHASEAYRREIVKVLTKRMIQRAWEQAKTLG
jgi:carbon-monoxide dehydrogenase medium subunit